MGTRYRIALLATAGLFAAWAGALPGPAQAGMIAEHRYTLLSHPDGNQLPPPYGLRLDGIEWFATNESSGGDSDTWTFDFTDMQATFTVNDGSNDDTFRIHGTAVGGRDTGGGSSYDGGVSVTVEIDFTYTDFDGQNDYYDPEIHVNDGIGTWSTKGTGSIKFLDGIHGIAKDTEIGLLAYADGSGNLFNFDSDPAPGHRLGAHCVGSPLPSYCGMPVGWGWLALTDGTEIYHTASQDFLFVDPQPIPEPSSLALFVSALAGFTLVFGIRASRRRSG